MKNIKQFLKKFDIFGVPFLFRYKKKRKYLSALGGLFFIIFCIITIFVEIYYFIPFFNRKNLSFLYYSMDLHKTEKINLKDSQLVMAIGLNCEIGEDGTRAEDILRIEAKYTTNRKDKEGINHTNKEKISTHSCHYSEFPSTFKDYLNLINIEKYQCLDKTDFIIEGIYTDELFTYYELDISAKDQTKINFDKIDNYLIAHDCKMQIYYTDITVDINDYKEPIKPFLNSLFMQLNPTLFTKMNAYFMKKYFINDDLLIYILQKEEPIIKASFSRYEQYYLYKGINRFETKPANSKNYARMYIRADTKKTEIKRKYQKLIEFYADSTSIMRGLFSFLLIILNFFNIFFSEYSISKKLFFFKEIENKNNHLDVFKRNKQIKKLISLTEPFRKIENKKERYYIDKNKIEKEALKKQNKIDQENNNSKRTEIIPIRSDISGNIIEKLNCDLNNAVIKRKMQKLYIKEAKKIKYSFNIFEIIIKEYFSCCLTKKLRLKKNINLKVNEILYDKIDIVSFIRNMILLDIMNQCLLGENKKGIIKFLSRPIISINKIEESKFQELSNDHFCEDDFDKLNKEITKFAPKSRNTKKEIRLFLLSNKQLKKLI